MWGSKNGIKYQKLVAIRGLEYNSDSDSDSDSDNDVSILNP